MANTGITLATDEWQVNAGLGQWNAPSNVLVDGDTYTTYSGVGFSAQTLDHMLVRDFGFAIPSGSTIDGIIVQARWRNVTGVGVSYNLNVFKDGLGTGTPSTLATPKTGTTPTSLGTTQVGGTSDLWGLSWTPEEINDPEFGIRLICGKGNGTFANAFRLSWLKVDVYYTPPPDVIVETDLQTVSVATQSATPEVTLPNPLEGVFVQPQDATINEAFEEVVNNAESVVITSQTAELTFDVNVPIDLQTVSITTQDAQALAVDFETIDSPAEITVNILGDTFFKPVLADGTTVDVTAFDVSFLVPKPQVLTLTSSVYTPVALTTRRVDLQFVDQDAEELIVIQTHGSPRVN